MFLLDTSWMCLNDRPAWRVIGSYCSALLGLGIAAFISSVLLRPIVPHSERIYTSWYLTMTVAKVLCAVAVPFSWPILLQDFVFHILHNYQMVTVTGGM